MTIFPFLNWIDTAAPAPISTPWAILCESSWVLLSQWRYKILIVSPLVFIAIFLVSFAVTFTFCSIIFRGAKWFKSNNKIHLRPKWNKQECQKWISETEKAKGQNSTGNPQEEIDEYAGTFWIFLMKAETCVTHYIYSFDMFLVNSKAIYVRTVQ